MYIPQSTTACRTSLIQGIQQYQNLANMNPRLPGGFRHWSQCISLSVRGSGQSRMLGLGLTIQIEEPDNYNMHNRHSTPCDGATRAVRESALYSIRFNVKAGKYNCNMQK